MSQKDRAAVWASLGQKWKLELADNILRSL